MEIVCKKESHCSYHALKIISYPQFLLLFCSLGFFIFFVLLFFFYRIPVRAWRTWRCRESKRYQSGGEHEVSVRKKQKQMWWWNRVNARAPYQRISIHHPPSHSEGLLLHEMKRQRSSVRITAEKREVKRKGRRGRKDKNTKIERMALWGRKF